MLLPSSPRFLIASAHLWCKALAFLTTSVHSHPPVTPKSDAQLFNVLQYRALHGGWHGVMKVGNASAAGETQNVCPVFIRVRAREGRASTPHPTPSPHISCPSRPSSSHCPPTQVCLFHTFTPAPYFPHTCCACGPGAPAPRADPTYLHGYRCTAGGMHCPNPLLLHSGCICSSSRCTSGGTCCFSPLHSSCSCRPPHCRYVPHPARPCHRPPRAAGRAVETTPTSAAPAPQLPRLFLHIVVLVCLLLPVLLPVLLTEVLLCLVLLVSTPWTVC